MDLVQGYKFFTPAECAKMRAYCDKKERQVRKVIDADAKAPPAEGKASIPVTQKHHYLYNFFGENRRYLPRLISCIEELLPHLEFPVAVQSWVNIYRKGQGSLTKLRMERSQTDVTAFSHLLAKPP